MPLADTLHCQDDKMTIPSPNTMTSVPDVFLLAQLFIAIAISHAGFGPSDTVAFLLGV